MQMTRTLILGELEVQHGRGVVYFHASSDECKNNGHQPTPLRIQGIEAPIPNVRERQIDLRVTAPGFDKGSESQYGETPLSGTPDKTEKGVVVVPLFDMELRQYIYQFDSLQDVAATIEAYMEDEEADDLSRAWGMLHGIKKLITENK